MENDYKFTLLNYAKANMKEISMDINIGKERQMRPAR